jgi:hypothetical protein
MTRVLTLAEAIALRASPVKGKRGGVAGTPAWLAGVAITHRIRTRFQRPADWATLTHGEQLVFTLHCDLDAEVKNGGLHQYLSNSSGDRAEVVKGYLSELGATELRAMFDEVSALFPNAVIPSERASRDAILWPSDEDARVAILTDVEVIERRYAGFWDDLWRRVMDYVEANRADFEQPTDTAAQAGKPKSRSQARKASKSGGKRSKRRTKG